MMDDLNNCPAAIQSAPEMPFALPKSVALGGLVRALIARADASERWDDLPMLMSWEEAKRQSDAYLSALNLTNDEVTAMARERMGRYCRAAATDYMIASGAEATESALVMPNVALPDIEVDGERFALSIGGLFMTAPSGQRYVHGGVMALCLSNPAANHCIHVPRQNTVSFSVLTRDWHERLLAALKDDTQ